MKIVNSFNEWDPLEEVILGVPDFACIPQDEPSYRTVGAPGVELWYHGGSNEKIFRSGLRGDDSIEKAKVQLDNLERILKYQCNVKVHRPEKMDYRKPITTPFFSVENQNCATCPRDTMVVIGNEVIESTMSNRARYFESMAYRKILNEIWEKDSEMLWTSAPKPTMADSMYNLEFPWDTKSEERKDWIRSHKYVTNETEPVFDAADILRLGKDLIVQHSFTTNRRGIEWLRRHTKSRGFRVHEIHFPKDLSPIHIDASLVPLVPPTKERKGILMTSPERPIDEKEMDKIFTGSNWEIKDAAPPFSYTVPNKCQSTYWLCMNLLMVSPERVIVEETEKPTIKFLESLGIKCIQVPFRDVYEFGGSIHCVTCDLRRRGECEDYFPNMENNNL